MNLLMAEVVKSQHIVDLFGHFPREEEFLLDDEVPREVAMVEVAIDEWLMKFDGSSTVSSGGVRVVLYHREGETVLSFKLEFLCLNNIVEYEVYLTGLAIILEIRV